MTTPFLPLTDMRRGYLEDLVRGVRPEWAAKVIVAWARREKLAEERPAPEADQLTPLGHLVVTLDREHGYNLHNRRLGMSPIAGGGYVFGSGLRCRCGWKAQNNETPKSPGGYTALKARHRAHVAELLEAAKVERGI
jgi:hypothetical protein